MRPRGAHAVPSVAVNRVLDDGVWATLRVQRRDAIPSVGDDHVVEDQRPDIARGDGDATVALGRAVSRDAVALDPDRGVLIDPAQQRDAGSARAGDREPTNRDEARLLEPDRGPARALMDGTVQHDASDRRGRIRLDHDPAALRSRRRILARDVDLLDVGARLDLDGVAWLCRVHRTLDAAVAGRVPAAPGIRTVHVADRRSQAGAGQGWRSCRRQGQDDEQEYLVDPGS